MKTSALVLFVLGILFAICAFLGDEADNMPFVLRLVAPEYTECQSGLVELEKEMILSPGDQGFEALAKTFLSRLARDNPPDRLAGVSITKIERNRPIAAFGKLLAGQVVKVTFSLSSGQTIDWSLDRLSEAVLALKTGRIFPFSAILLSGGILIQIVGFLLQVREARRKLGTIFAGAQAGKGDLSIFAPR